MSIEKGPRSIRQLLYPEARRGGDKIEREFVRPVNVPLKTPLRHRDTRHETPKRNTTKEDTTIEVKGLINQLHAYCIQGIARAHIRLLVPDQGYISTPSCKLFISHRGESDEFTHHQTAKR